MDDPNAIPEPPLVMPVAPARPRPGFLEALLLTFGFWVVLIGSIIGIVVVGAVVISVQQGPDSLKPPEGANPYSVDGIPPAILEPLAWSFPISYFVGLLYTLLVFRLVSGKGWVREAGLMRLPLVPLGLALVALPGFMLASDLIGGLVYQAFRMEDEAADQQRQMRDLFKSFHWSFCVLALGIGPGLVEELWCRGFLGRGLVGRYGWVRGVTLTSLFFGLLHVYPPPYVLVTALMGAGLHYLYITSRSLWVPITVHLLNNTIAVLLAVGVIPSGPYEKALEARPVLAAFLAAGLLVSAGLALWSARGRVHETAAHRGIMVPRGCTVRHERPNPLWTLLAVGFCGGLIALLLI